MGGTKNTEANNGIKGTNNMTNIISKVMTKVIGAGGLALLLCWAMITAAMAHDYWITPDHYSLDKGDTLTANLYVGGDLVPEVSRALSYDMTKSYHLITSRGTIDLLAETPDGTDPFFSRKMTDEGLAMIAMERKFYRAEMTDKQFSDALEHEEMNDLIALRQKIGHKDIDYKRYGRSIKSLVRVGDKSDGDLYKKILGHQVEIILLDNPFTLKEGDKIRVQLLNQGKPLANKLIKAMNRDDKGYFLVQKALTDQDGKASFVVGEKGHWVIRVSHMWYCPDCGPDSGKVNWEQYFSTYSFSLN